MGVYTHKHTDAAIVLTVFALVLAMSSMTLPYYKVVDGRLAEDDRVYYNTFEFYPSYYQSNERTGDYASFWFEEVGGLFNLLWVLIWVWAFGAMFYILRVLRVDESEFRWWQGGFIAGWVLAGLAVMPALVFALLIDSSYATDVAEGSYSSFSGFVGSSTYDEWGPMSGWMMLAFACAVQVVAVLLRNVPALLFSSKGPQEVPPELAGRGDLPVR